MIFFYFNGDGREDMMGLRELRTGERALRTLSHRDQVKESIKSQRHNVSVLAPRHFSSLLPIWEKWSDDNPPVGNWGRKKYRVPM